MKVSNIALTGAVLGMAQASPIATREAITDGMSPKIHTRYDFIIIFKKPQPISSTMP